MRFKDFSSYEEGKAFKLVLDKKKVGSGQARGWMSSNGLWLKLKLIQADRSHPLFSLADAIIITASDASSFFGVDLETKEGKTTLEGLHILREQGELSDIQREEFLAMSLTEIQPFSHKTRQDWEVERGTIKRVATITEKGFCKITLSVDCERHNPQIYRKVTFLDGNVEYIRIAGFNGVELAGVYRTQCPTHLEVYVDNAYGVIE